MCACVCAVCTLAPPPSVCWSSVSLSSGNNQAGVVSAPECLMPLSHPRALMLGPEWDVGTASWGAHGHVGGSRVRAGPGRSRQAPRQELTPGQEEVSFRVESALAQSLGHPRGNGRGGRQG